jgi:CheY-like chemotaxis protein
LKSGQHLLLLINDILDLSRIETGRIAFELSAMNAASAVDECVGLIASLAEKSDLTIINHLKSNPPPPIMADAIRLKQALLNLLSNAVKFNAPGGRVEVSARSLNAEFVRISISDTGIGIPEEKATVLFEPFGRLDAERRGIEGTGIGLTITKELVERMKGTIGYSSTPGQGSTFWLDIPTAGPGISKDRAAAAGLDLGADQDNARETVILYIEDDLSNRQLFTEVVSHLPGTKLLSAHSAEEGIQIANDVRPDVIVMDINLPGMSGLEAARILREDANTRAIPVIALSAAAMPGDIEKGERAGLYPFGYAHAGHLRARSADHRRQGKPRSAGDHRHCSRRHPDGGARHEGRRLRLHRKADQQSDPSRHSEQSARRKRQAGIGNVATGGHPDAARSSDAARKRRPFDDRQGQAEQADRLRSRHHATHRGGAPGTGDGKIQAKTVADLLRTVMSLEAFSGKP